MAEVQRVVGTTVGVGAGTVLSAGLFEVMKNPCGGFQAQARSVAADNAPYCFPTGESMLEYWSAYGAAFTALSGLIGWLIARAGYLDDLLLDPPLGEPQRLSSDSRWADAGPEPAELRGT